MSNDTNRKTVDEANRKHAAELMLILGGARSGKSRFAEQLALRSGRSVAFVATATATDEDMHDRIQHHRLSRPQDWITVEEPLKLAEAVNRAAEMADVILVDCLTIWLSNWLFAQGDPHRIEGDLVSSLYTEGALAEINAFLSAVAELDERKTVMVVTNEVGLGIVPSYTLGRIYRDVLGRVNQRVAELATRVYLMVAGLGVDIKRLHEEASL